MTIEEELNRLEDNLRRLKIEYEIYFNGGAPRPPNDLVFRVEKTIKKVSAGTGELTFQQRFRFNQLTQSYAIRNDLWRKKLKMKEEGLQPASAHLHSGAAGPGPVSVFSPFSIEWSDPDQDKVEQLLEAVVRAKAAAGQSADDLDPQIFADFIRDKTSQLKETLECGQVRFSVTVEEGRVKLCAARVS